MFVRLTGCHLRCRYCDTEYAFHEGRRWGIDEIVAEGDRLCAGGCLLWEVTGGEPLLQPAVHELMGRLADRGRTVLLETSGACDIAACDPRVIRIMDLKTPDSGEEERNRWSNIEHLRPEDEVKFVLCSQRDYEWARGVIRRHQLPQRVRAVLLSAAAPMARGKEIAGLEKGVELCELARWMLADHWPAKVRMQTQLHKLIWPAEMRGV